MKSTDVLSHFALRLRNADPEGFEQFVAAFDAYTGEITVAVTDAPQDQILNMQGRAKQCLAFLRLFRECHIQKPTQPQPPAKYE